MKNIKKMISSALIATAFAVTSVGTTFALFTDEARTSINVGTGIVDIGLTASGLKLYSADTVDHGEGEAGTISSGDFAHTYYYQEMSTAFANSGTATLADNVLTLERVTPGDRVTFDVALASNSNVNIKYRLVLNTVKVPGQADKLLAKALEVTTDLMGSSVKYQKLEKYVSSWIYHSASSVEPLSKTFHFDIALPIDAGNLYQDRSVQYYLNVQAVQGNAHTSDDEAGIYYFLIDEEEVVENQPTELEASNSDNSIIVNTVIPASEGLDAGSTVELIVSDLDVSSETESTTLNFDVSLYVDGEKKSNFNEDVTVQIYVGPDLEILTVYHKGVLMDPSTYVYDIDTGVITFTTQSFSPFSVTYKEYPGDTSKGYADSYEEEIDDVTYSINELSRPKHFKQMLNDLAAIDVTDSEELEAAQKTIYKLTADIDLDGYEGINRGILCGILDGNNHSITNYEYDGSDAAAGLFAKYYSGSVVKNLTIDYVNINGKENVGAIFGQSYLHASGASSTVSGTSLTFENVTIGSHVTVSGTKGVGGLVGSTRWIETLTFTDVVNNADVSAETYNVGGFAGTLAGVKTLNATNCVNNGNIRGPHNVAGFVGQSPALTTINLTDCENHGRIIDFSSKDGKEANAGWFVGCCASNCELNYSGNTTDGTLYYVSSNASFISVFEKTLVGDTEESGIRVASGKTWQDYMVLDDTVLLGYEIENNQFVVDEVAGADHYTITMQVWGRDVRLEGDTITVYKEKYLSYSVSYETVEELHDNFGRITRAGYFINSVYTEYDYDPTGGVSNSATLNGRANFFRLPYAQKAAYAEKYDFNKPSYDADLGEWVYILDGEADCLPGLGHILSPKNTSVTYLITAYDANGHAIANCLHRDDAAGMNPASATDVSGSFLKNMAGDIFFSASPDTTTGTHVYDPVA